VPAGAGRSRIEAEMSGQRRPDPLAVVLAVFGVLVLPPVIGLAPHGWASIGVPYWTVLGVVHVAFVHVAGRVAAVNRNETGAHRLWTLAAWAGVPLVAGDLVEIYECLRFPPSRYTIIGGNVQAATVVVAMTLLLVGMLRFPSGRNSPGERSRLRMDMATVMGSATTCGLLLLQLPQSEAGWRWAVDFTTAVLVEPGVFLVALFALVKLFLGDRPPFTRPAAIVTGAAGALQAIVQAVPASFYLKPHLGTWVMAGNVAASTLLAVGFRIQWLQNRSPARGAARGPRRPYSSLPYAAMAVSWAAALGVMIADGLSGRTWSVVAGAMLTTALVVARQAFAFKHIEELLRERDVLAARLTEQAYHDALTGLANRALFMNRLAESLATRPVTVFLIDLDDFKPVNDSYGHATGDRLLIEVAARLRRSVRAGDTVARLGGDEFAVLAADPAGLLDELTANLNDTLRLGDAEVRLRASIGMATGHPDRHGPDSVLHEADMAMYATKNAGRAIR
jgi:diguanylate cyclase (GGDEF)-like protein